MARLPRPYLPGCAQHIIQRGNNRAACFYDGTDHSFYLACLKEAAEKYQVALHAFVLMTNHVHLLATPRNETGTPRMMQALGRRYVRYFNHVHRRTGTLWEGRYKSTVVDTETYLLRVYRYIELNPVRAGMVEHASEYPWSSYQHNAVGKEIHLITPHAQYQALGNTPSERQANYRSLFKGRMLDRDLTEIREATNKARVLGSDSFKRHFEAVSGRRAITGKRGGDRRSGAYKLAMDQGL